MRAAVLGVGLVVMTGCPTTRPAPQAQEADAAAPPGSPDASAAPDAGVATAHATGSTAPLVGYPLQRLQLEGQAVHTWVMTPTEQDRDAMNRAGVVKWLFFQSESPAMRHMVFEIKDGKDRDRAQAMLEAWVNDNHHAYYVKASVTGPWLLLTGFPSEKPPSPEMEVMRDRFVSAFAGAE